MSDARIHELLKEAMGLDVATIGTSSIERAVQQRQAACGITDVDAYCARLQASSAELQNLIEAVVVPETWFFRDADAFAALTGSVAAEWMRSNTAGVFRLLSLPCSTGEEPYSMAMALLDAGWPPDRFQIDAVDISSVVIAHAQAGVYRRHSFRGDDLAFRHRHFTQAGDGYQLRDAVRRQVRFQQGNVFSSAFLPGDGVYDAIFCRNMLIYFDRPTQARVTSLLWRLLASTGSLFVGASETGIFLNTAFVSAKLPMAFAFRKGTAPAAPRPAPMPSPPRMPRVAVARHVVAAPAPARAPLVAAAPAPAASLDAAKQLADQGRFAEAAERCEAHLRQHGPAADAFYLLGLVRDASGNHADAAAYYRKALYLDPNHGEALMHLALMMEDQGKSAEAQLLRNRLKRVAEPRKG